MRKYRKPRTALRHWMMILKPGQCIEFIAADFGLNRNTLIAYLEWINRRYRKNGLRFATCTTGTGSVGVRRLTDTEVAHA